MKNLLIRTASALVFAVLVLGSIYLGKTWTMVVMCFFMCVALFEVNHFVNFRSPGKADTKTHTVINTKLVLYIIAGIIFYIISVMSGDSYTYRQWSSVIILFFVSFFILIMKNRRFIDTPFIFKTASLFYITVPFILFMTLFQFSNLVEQESYFFPYCLFATIWIGDTFAYFAGSLLGKHKMFPKISPKKSWEGFFGGLIAILLLAVLFSNIAEIQVHINETLFWMGFCLIIYIFGTFGDFFESYFKRCVGIKDSGKIMPGHGGALDRFDSFLFSIPCIIIYLLTIIY